MRRIVLVLMLLGIMTAVFAQQAETLSWSKSLVAIKLTDPEKQIAAFAPLLQMIDTLMAHTPKPNGPTSATAALTDAVTKLKQVPGINATGDFWILMMPPDPKAPAPEPKEGEAPNPMANTPTFAVLPLTDPVAFNAFLLLQPGVPKRLQGVVLGNQALVSFTDQKPTATALNMDLPLLSKRGIVMSVQLSQLKLDSISDQVPPAATLFLGPLLSLLTEQQRNIARAESGLAMIGNDLSVETFTIPVANSPLATSIAAVPAGPGIALDYAAYLPENALYAGAAGPMLKGAPGLGLVATRTAVGFLGMFLPRDRFNAFSTALDTLVAQGSQGRALAWVPAPAGMAPAIPGLVAVYRVTSDAQAKAAMRSFLREVIALQKTAGNSPTMPVITLLPEAEKIGDVPVDVLRATQPAPAATPTPKPAAATPAKPKPGQPAPKPAPPAPKPATPAAKPLVLEVRAAYVGEKMLVAAGGGSKDQLAALLARVQGKKTGYTAGARFKTLQPQLPANVRGFEAIALDDLIRLVLAMAPADAPPSPELAAVKKVLADAGPLAAVLSTWQEANAGMLHGETRLPGEQLKLLFALLDVLAQQQKGAAPAPAK